MRSTVLWSPVLWMLALTFQIFFGDIAFAEIWRVPADSPSLQDAVDGASDGDVILISPGIYTGPGNRDIEIAGRDIEIRSEEGADLTIFDLQGKPAELHRGFRITGGADVVIEGLTIRNGYLIGNTGGSGTAGGGGGAAIYTRDSHLVVHRSVIGDNVSATLGIPLLVDGRGAGIYIDGNSSVRISSTQFFNNQSGKRGGAIYAGYAETNLVIENSVLSDNHGHTGGGIHMTFGDFELRNSTLLFNSVDSGGGGVRSENASIHIVNSILWGNEAPFFGDQLAITSDEDHGVMVEFSNIEGGFEEIAVISEPNLEWGFGNIDQDPMFWSVENGDLRLRSSSPCVNRGKAEYTGDPLDLFGGIRIQQCRVDLGAVESEWFRDCDQNGISDGCDIAEARSEDCNLNAFPDSCDIASGLSVDSNGDEVPDECQVPTIVSSFPPNGSIDARAPSTLDGLTPLGLSGIELEFVGEAIFSVEPSDFLVTVTGGEAPSIDQVIVEGQSLHLIFDGPIPAGHCTTITHPSTGYTTTIGFNPGDVDGILVVNILDLLTLEDHLNGEIEPPLEIWQCDLNWSGECNPSDILTWYDLLSGAEGYDSWAVSQLPGCP